MRWKRSQPAMAMAVAGSIILAGCGGVRKDIDRINASGEAYSELQGFIQAKLATTFRRPVRSVSCTPHVSEVLPASTAHMTCVVDFTNGTSYVSQGAVIDPSTDPDIATYTYSFTDPPAIDLTTAPLPMPASRLSAASSGSLLSASNLGPVLRGIRKQFGKYLIVQLDVSPGELQAVVAANGQARLVTATSTGSITAGPPAGFSGSRDAISFSQLEPRVIQQLTAEITSRAHIPLARISRFVLVSSLPGGNSGWNIYLSAGSTRFQALVLGQDLKEITSAGTRQLG
jgi:hypothetical protein